MFMCLYLNFYMYLYLLIYSFIDLLYVSRYSTALLCVCLKMGCAFKMGISMIKQWIC